MKMLLNANHCNGLKNKKKKKEIKTLATSDLFVNYPFFGLSVARFFLLPQPSILWFLFPSYHVGLATHFGWCLRCCSVGGVHTLRAFTRYNDAIASLVNATIFNLSAVLTLLLGRLSQASYKGMRLSLIKATLFDNQLFSNVGCSWLSLEQHLWAILSFAKSCRYDDKTKQALANGCANAKELPPSADSPSQSLFCFIVSTNYGMANKAN